MEEENRKWKKKYKQNKVLSTLLKTVDTFVIIATTSSSATLSITGSDSITIPISTGIASGLGLSNKVLYEKIMSEYNQYKKIMRAQQAINCFDNSYRKFLKDKIFDKKEYETLLRKM